MNAMKLGSIVTLVAACAGAFAAPLPEFKSGDKTLELVRKNAQGELEIDLRVNVKHLSTFTFGWCGSIKGGTWGSPFGKVPAGTQVTADWDDATKTATLVKPYLAGSEIRRFTVRVKVPEEGIAEVDWSGNPDMPLCSAGFYRYAQNGLTMDGVEYVQPPFSEILAKPVKVAAAREFKIASDDPDKSVGVSLPDFRWGGYTERGIDDKWGRRRVMGLYASNPTACRMKIDFRMPKKVSPYPVVRGIDFGKYDGLHVPLTPTRNLLMNPSFEGGLRYWALNHNSCHYYTPTNVLPNEVVEGGLFGRHALRLRKIPGDRHLFSFPMPLEDGKTYTLSFYGKSATGKGTGLSLGIATACTQSEDVYPGQHWVDGDWRNPACRCALGPDWKRFSRTFKGSVKGFVFSLSNADALLDGFQLEEGDKATEYTDAPLYGNLVTSAPRNILEDGAAPEARMDFSGRPGVRTHVTFALENVYREIVWKGAADITPAADGAASYAFPWSSLPKGLYVMRVDYATPSPSPSAWTDYFRLTVIKSLDNRHPTKSIFGCIEWFDHARADEVASLYRRIGVGKGMQNSGWFLGRISRGLEKRKTYVDLLRRHRISWTPVSLYRPDETGIGNLRTWTEITPEMEKKLEDYAYRFTEGLPIDLTEGVAFYGEDELSYLPAHGMYEEYFKAQTAVIRGAKRRDPRYLGGPTIGTFAYGPIGSSGKAISNYLRVSKEKGFRYEFVGVHCYGSTDKPNRNDLDANLEYLRADMLKYGYGPETGITVSETGNGHFTYIPEWRCTGWGDYYQRGKPSYAWGIKELDIAAEYTRMYLVALKYHPQMKSMNTWVSPLMQDIAFTPNALATGINALGNLLPDCRFVTNVRPTGMMRGFAFERPLTKDALVALWSVDPGHVDGSKPAAHLRVALPQDTVAYDFAGNRFAPKRTEDGLADFAITQFPLYVSGADARKLAAAFNGAESDDISVNLGVTCVPTPAGTVDFRLKNRIARNVRGAIEVGGKSLTFDVPAGGERRLRAPDAADEASVGKVYAWNRAFRIVPERGDPVRKSWAMDYFYVPYCEGSPDWKTVPTLKAANRRAGSPTKDMSVDYQVAWNEQALYLRVTVRDTQRMLFPEMWQKQGSESTLWNHDGALEVYFDTFTDARSAASPAIDDNDYRYDFACPKDGGSGRGLVCRFHGVNQQYADGLNYPKPEEAAAKVLSDFQVVPGGYVYTITFPQRYLQPFEFKPGSTVGFGLQCHDRDPDPAGKKPSVCSTIGNTTREGVSCNESPHLWPLLILKK